MEANKYGIALHTTTPELGLAISNYIDTTRSQVWNLERELSSHLHTFLMEFIKPQTWKDMAFIAVAKGPGGFTGTRIGMVAARTLGQQLNIPVFAVSTLAAVALEKAKQKGANIIAVEMPAQRGQVFGAVYQFVSDEAPITTLLPDTVFTPQAWQSKLASFDSYDLVEAKSNLATTVTSILQLAYLDWQQGRRPIWSEAIPFYGQHPVDN